ncbi:hypothetical protein Pth03_76470 [Planotetraspora thailandica]|uniref:Uncharacterized protein n=1 Tax=Planotetraspora thailandica TaxID=487172 RepID=A0A8J3Y1Q4_9ACTN|nr:hypothetical protein [Planotetraspora thailandica]GII59258.1 hypothetical protein Pth03_76470 [Planotetraspora thailandica]
MTDAVTTQTGVNPDRAGFNIAWRAASDQIIHAANVIPGAVIDQTSYKATVSIDILRPTDPCHNPLTTPPWH